MKNIRIYTIAAIAFFVILIILNVNDNNKVNNKEKTEKRELSDTKVSGTKDSIKVKLIKELPPLKTCSSEIGFLRSDINGYSIGSRTELTELKKMLKKSDCDKIEIIWVWTDSEYPEIPMKLTYNRRNGRLNLIYTKTNVKEELKGVDEKGLVKFLNSGEKDIIMVLDYTDSEYDFNNREMKQTAVGSKPKQSEWDGSVKVVKEFIKSNAKDASSVKFIEWSMVSQSGAFWVVRCKFKGTNAFGGVVTQNVWFYIQNNKVVDTKDIGV